MLSLRLGREKKLYNLGPDLISYCVGSDSNAEQTHWSAPSDSLIVIDGLGNGC